MQRAGEIWEVMERLYLDLGEGYTDLHICLNSLNSSLKIVYFIALTGVAQWVEGPPTN